MLEIVRKERKGCFADTGTYLGPYPSGDTCIMLDVAARLGKKCCFIGPGSEDAFAEVVPDRLKKDGVDVHLMKTAPGSSSIVVFVRYDKNGQREYLNFMDEKLLNGMTPELIPPEVVANSEWIHFSGEIISLCTAGRRRESLLKLLHEVSFNSKVSLDPNFTIEIEDMQSVVGPFIKRANLILPSEGEAKRMMGTTTDEAACEELAAAGKTVVLKRGKKGCDIYEKSRVIHVEGWSVKEVDPTGCGDSFLAGFLTGLLEGWSLEKTGRFANAVGAMQAAKMGPMEGAAYFSEVVEFIKKQSSGREEIW